MTENEISVVSDPGSLKNGIKEGNLSNKDKEEISKYYLYMCMYVSSVPLCRSSLFYTSRITVCFSVLFRGN